MIIKIFTLFLAIGFFSSTAANASNCDASCQKNLIDNYYEHLSVVYRGGSNDNDIQALFSLFHDQVKYEHIEYDANFNKNDWIAAFQSNLHRGAYNKGPLDSIKVDKYIYGKNYVAVEYSYGERSKEGNWKAKGDQHLLAIFGFRDDKIVLVREYW